MEQMTDALTYMPFLVFFITGTVAVASSILVVAMRNPVHSALFLLLTFLCVAVLFFLVEAEFVGAVQILVYAGGIMVLFLFVVMLINVRHLPDEKMISPYWKGALAIGFGLFVLFATIIRGGAYHEPVDNQKALRTGRVLVAKKSTTASGETRRRLVRQNRVIGNSEAIGLALYRDYLVPFEVASVFLLVAMIGAIVIGKRDLYSEDEELVQQFIVDRAAEEKDVKEAVGA